MRRTVMAGERGGRVTVETGDNGTLVLDAAGMVLASHGTDRHEEMVVLQRAAGLGVVEEGDVRPEEAADAGTPPDNTPDGIAEVEIGPSS
jgi:hypothetical protein